MAKIAHFYGWTHDQILDLDVDYFDIYWQAIPIIEAQKELRLLRDFDWPNNKNSTREKLHRQLYKAAYPASFNDEVKEVDNASLARLLGG